MNRRSFIQSGIAFSTAGMGCLAGAQAAEWNRCADEHEMAVDSSVTRLRSAENPYGPPPGAAEAVASQLAIANRYPRPVITAFREKIAQDTGLTSEHVAIGAGSIELIIQTGLAFGKPGCAHVSGDPTWDTMLVYAQAKGADWIRVPLTKTYHYDFDRMLAAITDKVEIVYLCHPNNPTGIAEDHDQLEAFVKEAARSKLVMVDEAFIDCLDNAEQISMKKLIPDHENVIVVRTFSKLWGMAGFRVGYLLAHPRVVAKLKATIPALEMQNRFGVAGAIAAYDDHAFIELSRQRMRKSRSILYEIFSRHGLDYIRSDTNFIAFQVPENSQAFVEKMERLHGVSIKSVSLADQRNWARVSCGMPTELDAFDHALKKMI
ncbi:MAG: aminotransferase class I/II-fold pyridoxal phosphate-dependent enzyme [Pirellulales bacterium]